MIPVLFRFILSPMNIYINLIAYEMMRYYYRLFSTFIPMRNGETLVQGWGTPYFLYSSPPYLLFCYYILVMFAVFQF